MRTMRTRAVCSAILHRPLMQPLSISAAWPPARAGDLIVRACSASILETRTKGRTRFRHRHRPQGEADIIATRRSSHPQHASRRGRRRSATMSSSGSIAPLDGPTKFCMDTPIASLDSARDKGRLENARVRSNAPRFFTRLARRRRTARSRKSGSARSAPGRFLDRHGLSVSCGRPCRRSISPC